MWFLYVLEIMISLVAFFIFISVIWLLFSHRNIKRQLQALEHKLASFERGQAPEITDAEAPPEILDEAQPSDPALIETQVVAKSESLPNPPSTPSQDQFLVFSPERAQALWAWLQANWFYAVSAISLGLAGIFLVQYGIENGLLPPAVRVGVSLGFGALLIGVGEWFRRRFGDHEGVDTAYLPSVFSAAGIVTLFAAIIFARLFYGLIGVELTFIGLAFVAALAVLIGWFYGPLMAAIGIGGALGAPFMTGGQSEDPSWLFGYFCLVMIAGLAIDAVRRWAWVSAFSLILGGGVIWLVYAGGGEPVYFVMATTVMVIATVLVPMLSLRPVHGGPMMAGFFAPVAHPWPAFPTRLVAGVMVFWAASAAGVMDTTSLAFWSVLVLGALLALFYALWLDRAPALTDLAMIAPLVMLGATGFEALNNGIAHVGYQNYAKDFPEDLALRAVTPLLGLGLLVGLAFVWRSLRDVAQAVVWCLAGCLIAPLMAVVLHLLWDAGAVIGSATWALHIAVVALAMGGAAQRFAAIDGAHKLRVSIAAMAALAMISLAAFSLFAETALTIALATTTVFAAVLDRRFNLPELGVFISVGVGVITYRLLVDPGFTWGFDAPIMEVLLTYGGAATAFAGALCAMHPMRRPRTTRLLESGFVVAVALLATVLFVRFFPTLSDSDHAMAGIVGSIWLIASFAHFHRHEPGQDPPHRFALLAGLIMLTFVVGVFVLTLTLANPLNAYSDPVLGQPLVNSLLLAYFLPAAIFVIGHRFLGKVPRWLYVTFGPAAILLAAIWLGFAIRHFWRGADLSVPGTSQPELYTYTIALLVVGAILIYRSLAKRSDLMRKLGVGVIAVAVAKVFLIDVAGLSGLTRVFSFLALGLCLAGVAWLNRWASSRVDEGDTSPPNNEAET